MIIPQKSYVEIPILSVRLFGFWNNYTDLSCVFTRTTELFFGLKASFGKVMKPGVQTHHLVDS